MLSIEVKGVGRLKLPISPATAEKLKSVARPAPFGFRDQTLRDESMRWTWEVPKSRVKIPALPWKDLLRAQIAAMQGALGLSPEARLEPVFDKLLVYERGQFFKAHQDSEKSDGIVASLVVVVPSSYSGGTVTGSQSNDFELLDLIDDSIELHHWMDREGREAEGLASIVGGDELYFTTPSQDMHPFESNYEGWQATTGTRWNAGTTAPRRHVAARPGFLPTRVGVAALGRRTAGKASRGRQARTDRKGYRSTPTLALPRF